MINRTFKPLKSRSFFVFGPRGVGKSTWLRENYDPKSVLYFNLLDNELFETFLLEPKRFSEIINLNENKQKIVIIDEIQKVPALLNSIHDEISKNKEFLFCQVQALER